MQAYDKTVQYIPSCDISSQTPKFTVFVTSLARTKPERVKIATAIFPYMNVMCMVLVQALHVNGKQPVVCANSLYTSLKVGNCWINKTTTPLLVLFSQQHLI